MLHHHRRPAPALRCRRRPAPGPLGRWHGRRPAGRRRVRRVVRVRGPRLVGRGDLVRCGDRPARHRAGLGQGHAVLGVPAQGTRHRRRPLPPLPQGRGRPALRVGGRRPAAGCGGQWRAGRAARGGRSQGRLRHPREPADRGVRRAGVGAAAGHARCGRLTAMIRTRARRLLLGTRGPPARGLGRGLLR